MLISYRLLQERFFDGGLPEPAAVADQLMFGAFEIEDIEERGDDTIIDVSVLPNRASDCLSHRGIARELSVLLDIPLTYDPLDRDPQLEPAADALTVALDDTARSPVYIGAYMTGVAVGPSPAWLTAYLEALGQRSINNVVDATNFVMLELGTPLHAFDAAKLARGDGGDINIRVRPAKQGETISVLSGETYELDPEMTVIADGHENTPLAIAGVKGGAHADIKPETTDIVLEAAKFDPVRTRKTSQLLKLRTDASQRFENEIGDQLPRFGITALAELIRDIADGTLVGYAHAPLPDTESRTVSVSTEEINGTLGTSLEPEYVDAIWQRYGFSYTREANTFTITVPHERLDLTIPADLVEEVGRVYGYRNIESAPLPPAPENVAVNTKQWIAERIRKVLNAHGFVEVYTHALRDDGTVPLVNALASDKCSLRQDLARGIREKLDHNEKNAPLFGLEELRLFEIGNVFTPEEEAAHVSIGVRMLSGKKRDARARTLIAEVRAAVEEAIGVTLDVCTDENEILECDLTKAVTEVSADSYDPLPLVDTDVTYQPFSVYPFVLRDIAFWTPKELNADDARLIIEDESGGLLKAAHLFDEYHKEGRTSYAFHLVFQAHDRTLSDKEVGDIMERVEKQLSRAGCEIR